MFWWVVSGLPLSGSDAAVEGLLARIRTSLAVLGNDRGSTGAAALVDSTKGLFLAHADAVEGDTVQAKVGEWRVSLRVLGQDARTNLVVLGMRSPAPPNLGRAIPVAEFEPDPGTKICVVFADGGVSGTFIGGPKSSLNARREFVPVDEVRFENPSQLTGGALLMSFDGKLLGAVGASVNRPGNAISVKAFADVQKGLAGIGGARAGFGAGPLFRPAPLVVAYSPSLTLIRRSVNGLISDGHRVDYAVLGLAVLDAPGGGAVVRLLTEKGPAARSGVQMDDVLLAIGDRPVRNRLDFFQAVLSLRPGEPVAVRLRHDGAERTVEIVPAQAKG